MNFTVHEFHGGSFLRQQKPVVVTYESDVNIIQPIRIKKDSMSKEDLISTVKERFGKAAPPGTESCEIFLLEGAYTIAAAALAGPLSLPVEVLSSLTCTSPNGQRIQLHLMPPAFMHALFCKLLKEEVVGENNLGITPDLLLTVDGEHISVSDYFNMKY